MNTTLIERTTDGEYVTDIFTKLANNRILFISEDVNDDVASEIVATLLLKGMEDHQETISLFINAERGDVRSILMIYDAMKMIPAPIKTICCGAAMNEITLLLAAGTKGQRFATKNAVISPNQLLHETSYISDLTNIKTAMDQSVKDNKSFMKALAKNTGHKLSEVMKDFERKKFFTPEQAKEYGIIDDII